MIKLVKHFLLPVYVGETYNSTAQGSPNFFLLSLSTKDIERYQQWRKVAMSCKNELKDGSQLANGAPVPAPARSAFAELVLHDYQPTFFDSRMQLCEMDKTRLANILNRLTGECLELSGDEAFWLDCLLEEQDQHHNRMSYVHAVVSDAGISWRGMPTYCDYEVSTTLLPWRDVDEPSKFACILTR